MDQLGERSLLGRTMKRKVPLHTVFVLGAITSVFMLTSCSNIVEQDPYAAAVQAAREAATSDFERKALQDGHVSRAEYEEATSLYVECLTENGWPTIRVEQDGIYAYQVEGRAEGDAWDTADARCRQGTVDVIEPLYVDSTINPNSQDFVDLVVACLKEHGIVEPSYSKNDFLESFDAPPWDPSDPTVASCMSRPVG